MARILLGVGGSIAAYKACDLTSMLVQAGHDVDVVMTEAAERFVTPLAFTALTHRPVLTQATWWSEAGAAAHLTATDAADVFVIAPCTANLLGKLAHGIGDEIVSTTYLGCAVPVLLAPAMHARMWRHPRVQANAQTVAGDGVTLIGPATGYLAEGQTGPGRMSEPTEIVAAVAAALDA